MKFETTPRPTDDSWTGQCHGWRGGFHERSNAKTDPIWRCRWCGNTFTPPPAPATTSPTRPA